MKLAFVGYGKMGKMMDSLAAEYGFEVVLRLDEFNNAGGVAMTKENFAGVDVAIEFTMPEAAIGNIEKLAALGVNTVVGTTGWGAHLERARAAVAAAGTGFVYASNFSVGVNVFERVAAETARLMAAQSGYEAWAWEIHHSAKKDAPSGTLLTLVEAMRKAGYERRIDQSASRAGAHPGTHEIGFDSAADTITLRHAARSREGFARGALHAARWVVGKKGFYEFRQVLFGGA
ncbi:MAG: dihydrodipicolinate reductase [Bryobacterales bacterium]|nr:dihydrodipicolinate reductase [Bryobacterales bacterium]